VTRHPFHREILTQIETYAAENHVPLQAQGDRYVGTTKPCYKLPTPLYHQIAREWGRQHPDLTPDEFVDLLDSLAQGETYNEFVMVGFLLTALPGLRQALDPRCLGGWLERAQGWAEADTICQPNFTADELLSRWKDWKSLLTAFAKSDNVHLRRASLVLLTKPLSQSDDPRLARQAFAGLDRLKGDQDILITKAVSWLLRALIRYHRQEVEVYLRDNADTLPKVAIRETRNKLASGVKAKRK